MKIKATKVHSLLQNHYNRVPLSLKTTEQILHLIGDPNSNPNKAIVTKLRLTPWADKSALDKGGLVCYTPNAHFPHFAQADNECHPSGLIYIDLDAKGGFNYEREMECLKQNPHVLAAWPSTRGIGIGSLLKADWTSPHNFDAAFTHGVDVIKGYGSSVQYVDWKCQNIAWLNYLSFSEQIYINWNSTSISQPEGIIYSDIYPPYSIRVHDTLPPPSNDQQHKLKHQTELEDWQEGELFRFIPEGKEYIRLYVGTDKYSQGERNSRLFMFGCWVAKLNPLITRAELIAQLWQLNLYKCAPPLSMKEVAPIASSVFKYIRQGKLYAPSRLKKMWFKQDCGLTPKEKQSVAGQYMGNYRKEKTLDLLKVAVDNLKKEGRELTQKNVAELSGKSIATVKRHWKELVNFMGG